MFVHVVLIEDLREDLTCPTEPPLKLKSLLLAHLSRRLTGELIVYTGIRRPSVVRPSSVRQHFKTTSPLKP